MFHIFKGKNRSGLPPTARGLAEQRDALARRIPYVDTRRDAFEELVIDAIATLEHRIQDTYAKNSTATLQNKLFNSCTRAIRWDSNRIGNRAIVAFVTNGRWIDSTIIGGLCCFERTTPPT